MAQRGAATLPGPAGNGSMSGRGAAGGPVPGPPPNGRARRGRPSRTAPAARARARLPELVVGVLLVAGGALAAVLWATREPTQRVLVAARTIERGETLDGTMVRWVQVKGDRIAAVDDPSGLGGRIAAVDIEAGSPLQVASLREPTMIGDDQVEYGLALDAGDFPVGLAAGDRVVVVAIPHPDETGVTADPVTLPATAEVMVAPVADLASGAKAVVNLLMARVDIPLVAGAADVRIARVGEAP